MFGSCYHSFGISILLHAKIIATVNLSLSYSSGLWSSILGISLNIA